MYGIIFNQLQKYTRERLGPSSWLSLLAKNGLEKRIYLPTQLYPNQELLLLVASAATSSNASVQQVLQDFGRFIVADLLKVYGTMSRHGERSMYWSTRKIRCTKRSGTTIRTQLHPN